MPLLYYWRSDNYRHDLDLGVGYHLNQASPKMHHIDVGDSLWAFTRASTGGYVLAAELVVRAKTFNPPGFRYGRFRVWGDLNRSRYFQVEGQAVIEPVIRELSIRVNAATLGQSFQGPSAVRVISVDDHRLLCAAAGDLLLEPRAQLLPEQQLESSLIMGDWSAVQQLMTREPWGISEARSEYLVRQAPTRNRQLGQQLQEMYEGKCQLCTWAPRKEYGESLCEGHHVQWLSRGGADRLDNLVLVCPNHHSAIHRCDAPFDYGDLSFAFTDHREQLRLNWHLMATN